MLNIKLLGPDCANCVTIERLCKEVVAENSVNTEIEKITEYKDIMSTELRALRDWF